MTITSPALVRVDRSIKPTYPRWFHSWLNPELENTGPAEFDLSQISLWVHPKQQIVGGICASFVYVQLRDSGLLKTCLGLRDGEEILKQAVVGTFQETPIVRRLFLWKSVAYPRFEPTEHSLRVPYISTGFSGDQLSIGWEHIYSKIEEEDRTGMIPL